MRSKYRLVEPDGIYFLTSTIVHWLPVFTTGAACQLLLDALTYCRKNKSLRLYAFVILDNHMHFIAEAPKLDNVLKAFKSFTAKEILRHAEAKGQDWLLHQLAFATKEYKLESQHQVWQEGLHPQLIQSQDMLRQKMEYTHNNPVRRGLVDLPEHWRYSSARNYLLNDHSAMEIDEPPW